MPDNPATSILFVVTEDWYFLSHRLELARAARDAGLTVFVATAPGARHAEITAEGFTHIVWRLQRQSMNPLREFATARDLVRIFKQIRPDLVHLVALKPILYGVAAARKAKVPAVVCSVTGLGYVFVDGQWKRRMLQRVVQRAYRRHIYGKPRVHVILQNPDDRRILIKRRMIHASQSSIIRGSGVDLERFAVAPQPTGKPIVLTHSRMLWDKGIGELAAAARWFRQQGIDCEFLLAGAPDPANPASIPEETLREWTDIGDITWLGPRQDIPELLATASLACLPSYREGLPLSLVEAAAAGRAIVATDVPGCREVVQPNRNGLLVPPRDSAALGRALAELLSDSPRRAAMGEQSRQLAAAYLSNEVVLSETLEVYARLLGEKWPTASAC